jgi:hypothetical protein
LFQVIVGPDSRAYSVHSSLLAGQSPVLYALVNNGMQESKNRTVTWPDVSEHTFAKFLEFAYTGTFNIKDPRYAEKHSKSLQSAPADEEPDKSTKCSDWLARYVDLGVFAECYGIEKLLATTTSTLNLVLLQLMIDQTPDDIISTAVGRLFEDCFSKPTPECLRRVVRSYIAMEGAAFWRNSIFEGIIKQSNALTYEFIDCLADSKKSSRGRCAHDECPYLSDVPASGWGS